MMADLSEAKVGDKLCLRSRFGSGSGRIAVIDRVTPSGRLVTASGTFTRDGRRCGDRSSSLDRTYASLATDDDIAGIYRDRLVSKIERFRRWDKLTPDDLKSVAALVARYEQS